MKPRGYQTVAVCGVGLVVLDSIQRVVVAPTIPGREGVLVLMNHQSLPDIPLVVAALRPHHPRIVTRERYAHGKPLISHMVRLYQYPTVEEGATGRDELKRIRKAARESPSRSPRTARSAPGRREGSG